jgi:L-threonylcarbamoyladenylate synthase
MSDFETDIERCLETLEQGGIILYPTDTVWGIGCDATNTIAVQKIYTLKARPDSKSMIVLVSEEKDILKYVASPDMAVFDYLNNTNKPTTVIYDGAISLADNLIAADGSIAIRIVREKFCRHLIKRFRKPIVSTSANISGQPTPKKYADILPHIREGVDYVVNYRQDDEKEYESSSVIKWNRDGSTTILRP